VCSGSEAGSSLRLIDSCITQHKAQGPSRTCNASKEEAGILVVCEADGVHCVDTNIRKVDIRLPGKGSSKLPCCEASPLNHHGDKVDPEQ